MESGMGKEFNSCCCWDMRKSVPMAVSSGKRKVLSTWCCSLHSIYLASVWQTKRLGMSERSWRNPGEWWVRKTLLLQWSSFIASINSIYCVFLEPQSQVSRSSAVTKKQMYISSPLGLVDMVENEIPEQERASRQIPALQSALSSAPGAKWGGLGGCAWVPRCRTSAQILFGLLSLLLRPTRLGLKMCYSMALISGVARCCI